MTGSSRKSPSEAVIWRFARCWRRPTIMSIGRGNGSGRRFSARRAIPTHVPPASHRSRIFRTIASARRRGRSTADAGLHRLRGSDAGRALSARGRPFVRLHAHPHGTAAAVAPLRSELTVVAHHANVSALPLVPELAGGIEREAHRVVMTGIGAIMFVFELDHPSVVIPHDIVPSIRHGLLPACTDKAPARKEHLGCTH